MTTLDSWSGEACRRGAGHGKRGHRGFGWSRNRGEAGVAEAQWPSGMLREVSQVGHGKESGFGS
jgi:hypothetical protein